MRELEGVRVRERNKGVNNLFAAKYWLYENLYFICVANWFHITTTTTAAFACCTIHFILLVGNYFGHVYYHGKDHCRQVFLICLMAVLHACNI